MGSLLWSRTRWILDPPRPPAPSPLPKSSPPPPPRRSRLGEKERRPQWQRRPHQNWQARLSNQPSSSSSSRGHAPREGWVATGIYGHDAQSFADMHGRYPVSSWNVCPLDLWWTWRPMVCVGKEVTTSSLRRKYESRVERKHERLMQAWKHHNIACIRALHARRCT